MFRREKASALSIQENSVPSSKEVKSAILIQSFMRRYLNRKRYAIKALPYDQLEKYKAFVVGNDPFMPKELDAFHVQNEKIAIIGTSGMRLVSLACKLGTHDHLPKIFLVDNSAEVIHFWRKMRDFMADCDTPDVFSLKLPSFLQRYSHLYRPIQNNELQSYANPDVKYLNQVLTSNISIKS